MNFKSLHALVGALCTLSLAACGSTPATGDASVADTAITDTAQPTDVSDSGVSPDAVVGAFQVQLVAPSDAGAGYTSAVGRVQDRPTPAQIVWRQQSMSGDCKLLTPRVPFCATACGTNAACVADNTCSPYATAQNVGTVHATGIRTSEGATEFDMILVANSYQTPGAITLAYPAFAEGDTLSLSAMGNGAVAAFSLMARGIAPLQVTTTAPTLQTGQPMTVAWMAPGQTGSTVHLHMDISHHGGSRGEIECDTADDGELTIPAELVTGLVALGVAGYPTFTLTRSSVGGAATSLGRVELVVSSSIEEAVTIPNLHSCISDADCTTGTCRADLTCG